MAEEKARKKIIVEEVSDAPQRDMDSEDVKTEEVTDSSHVEDEEPKTEVVNLDEKPQEDASEEVEETQSKGPEKPSAPEPPPQPMKEKISLRFVILLAALIAIVLGGLIGGIVVFVNGTKEAEPSPTPITETPSPTPSAEPVAKSKYTVNIQNGSGIAGEGSKLQDLLIAKEFQVGTVGNAKSFNFKKTVVQAKSDVDSAFLSALRDVLSDAYSLDEDEKLPESSTVDIIIVIGSDKASE